jgi:hypothetical protein
MKIMIQAKELDQNLVGIGFYEIGFILGLKIRH